MESDGGLCGVTLWSHAILMGADPIMMSLVADITD
jgi:hypothetical protein